MAFVPTAQKAQRAKLKASILIDGMSGDGKSGLALQAAYYLSGEDFNKVGAVDTENMSLPLYIGKKMPDGTQYQSFWHYNLDNITGYKPEYYLLSRQDAVKNQKVEAMIFDSISHAWAQKDGVLDLVTNVNISKNTNSKNFNAWNDEEVRDQKQKLLELIRHRDCHQICTGRIKKDYIISEEEVPGTGRTRQKIEAKGMALIQESSIEFEPDLVIRMVTPGSQTEYPKGEILKSRYDIFTKGEIYTFTPQVWRNLKEWLENGKDMEEIEEEMRLEYIEAITKFLDTNPKQVPIYSTQKSYLGFNKPLKELTLEQIKRLYMEFH